MFGSRNLEARIAESDRVLALDEPSRIAVADALLEKARALGALKRAAEANDCLREVIARFGDSSEVELRVRIAEALRAVADELSRHGEVEGSGDAVWEFLERFGYEDDPRLASVIAGAAHELVAVCDALIKRYRVDGSPAGREQLARGLWMKSILQRLQDGREKAELKTLDALLAIVDDELELGSYLVAGWALYRRGQVLDELGRGDEALLVWQQVIDRFPSPPSDAQSSVELAARYARCSVLKDLKRWAEAASECDTMIWRYRDEAIAGAQEHDAREARSMVVNALWIKVGVLEAAERTGAMLTTIDALLSRFRDCDEPEPRDKVIHALYGKL